MDFRSYPPRLTGQVLVIPKIEVIVGKVDAELVVENVRKNQNRLIREVFEQLSRIDGAALITLDAGKYIERVIKNSINKVILGEGYREDGVCWRDWLSNSGELKCRAIQSVRLSRSFIFRDEARVSLPPPANISPASDRYSGQDRRLNPSMSKEEIYKILGTPAQ